MRDVLRSLASLLFSVALLMAGAGLLSTHVGLRSAAEGFPREATGLMMSAYYVGLVLGTLYCGRLINRIGHIRAFATFCSVSCAAVLVFPFAVSIPLWAVLRAINGCCLAGSFMVVESWLNARATGSNRGTLLALYMFTTYLAMGSGQVLINLGDASTADSFLLAGALLSLALVPVTVTRATHPAPVESSAFGLRRLFAISPLSVLGCIVSGLCVGALYGLGPIFAREAGMTLGTISQFMGALVLGGLVFQFPIGRLSDRFDRRKVLVGVSLAASLCALAVVAITGAGIYAVDMPWGRTTLLLGHYLPFVIAAVALFGGITATLYPLSVAFANDYVEPQHMVQASAGLVLAYGVGAAVGPLGAALIMSAIGPEGLFYFCGTAPLLLVAFALYLHSRRPRAPLAEKEAFVALPEATAIPTALDHLDPRTEGTQLALDLGMPVDEATDGEPAQPEG